MRLRRVNVGIVGAGGWAAVHGQAYRRNKFAKIIAVSSRTENHARSLARRVRAQRYYVGHDRLLEDEEIEAVSIALPPYLHPPYVIKAAEMRKHILCEKPLALSVDEVERIYRAVNENNVKLQVGFNERFHQVNIKLKSIFDSEALGKPRAIFIRRLAYSTPVGWRRSLRQGGGVLNTVSIHDMDLMPWLTGCRVKNVFASTGPSQFQRGVDDQAWVLMRFDKKQIGVSQASWAHRIGMRSIEANLEEATIIGDYSAHRIDITRRGSGQTVRVEKTRTVDEEIQAYLDSVMRDTHPVTTEEEMKRVTQLLVACRESMRRGSNISILGT